MDRADRVIIAKETLEISQKGSYTTMDGKKVKLGKPSSQFWSADKLKGLDAQHRSSLVPQTDYPQIDFLEKSVVVAIYNLAAEKTDMSKVGVLNFASAYHPGGGFLNGAMAQEEALSYVSNLYLAQLGSSYYVENEKVREDKCYTDNMIFSKVSFFREEDGFGLLPKPVVTYVLTAPAVNMSAVRQKGQDVERAKRLMKNRMGLILDLFAEQGCTHIILGAYGCGVFGNVPLEVAGNWRYWLDRKPYFERVIMPVIPDKRNGDENVRMFRSYFEIPYHDDTDGVFDP